MVSEFADRPLVVTGATGFIGGSIVRLLCQAGFTVRALVRSKAGVDRLIEAGVEPVMGSLEDPDSLSRLVDGAYAVVHCAGAVRGATAADFDEVNVEGVRQITAAACAQKRPPRFLLLSSLAAREPELSFYAASKRGGEEVLAGLGDKLSWTVFRPPAVYGPGDRELLPLFQLMVRGFAPIVGNSSARFSMLFVEDLSRAVLQWLRQEEGVSGQVLELDDGRPGGYTWRELADEVGQYAGRRLLQFPVPVFVLQIPALFNAIAGRLPWYRPMLTPGKIRELRHPDWVCSNDGIAQAINWKPKVSLIDGLRDTLGNVA